MIYPFDIRLLSVCHPFPNFLRYLERKILRNSVLILMNLCDLYVFSIIHISEYNLLSVWYPSAAFDIPFYYYPFAIPGEPEYFV